MRILCDLSIRGLADDEADLAVACRALNVSRSRYDDWLGRPARYVRRKRVTAETEKYDAETTGAEVPAPAPGFLSPFSTIGISFLGHPAPAGELSLPQSAYRRRTAGPHGVVVLHISKPRPGRAPPFTKVGDGGRKHDDVNGVGKGTYVYISPCTFSSRPANDAGPSPVRAGQPDQPARLTQQRVSTEPGA